MNQREFSNLVSKWAKDGTPFFFLVDFEKKDPIATTVEEAADMGIYFEFHGKGNRNFPVQKEISLNFNYSPISKEIFAQKFKQVQEHLKNGDTYLLNLTFPSQIHSSLQLDEIFQLAQAPYKLLYQDKFVVFSPECFIRIQGNQILTYPMKGTINANIPGAKQKLLENQKEIWEHNTIVDLMRNDLSRVSQQIEVSKYRFVDRIHTNRNELLQTSSEIRGNLPENWRENLGHLILTLLPAGSISGAPKEKTMEIILENESNSRGYYTGVFGIFDGQNLESAVAIRFIEQKEGKYWFRSGGGITFHSTLDEEYEELIQKIYVPTF